MLLSGSQWCRIFWDIFSRGLEFFLPQGLGFPGILAATSALERSHSLIFWRLGVREQYQDHLKLAVVMGSTPEA
jgi:hypothetical protein